MNTKQKAIIKKNVKWAAVLIFAFWFVIGALYFLAGNQLHFRNSKNNIDMLPATSGAIEITKDTYIKQDFISKTQIFEGISILFGTYGRTNIGTVSISLIDNSTSTELASKVINCKQISENSMVDLMLTTPNETLVNHTLSIIIKSDDCVVGNAVSTMMNSSFNKNNYQLFFNEEIQNGILCFSTHGTDYVWTGLYYWKLATICFLLLIIYLSIILFKIIKGKNCYTIDYINNLKKYMFLIKQMISRDFKSKYKRSVLGVFWSFLNPLLMMIVQYFIFSTLFKSDIPNYHIYLLIGIVVFNFFSEACNMTLVSIIGNANLITKVYIPKFIYPVVRVFSSVINLSLALIPLFLVIIGTRIDFTKSFILIIFPLLCLIIFSLGIGMLLATMMVFFRDTQFLWGVISMIWMYATPIFYPASILPNNLLFILKINPIYHYIDFIRTCILQGVSPEPRAYLICFITSVISLLLGSIVFNKNEDKFIFYL